MGPITKLLYLENMAMGDMSTIMSPSEFSNYVELRHRTKRIPPSDVEHTEFKDETNGRL